MLADVIKIPIGVSLGAISLILAASVFASIRWPKKADDSRFISKSA